MLCSSEQPLVEGGTSTQKAAAKPQWHSQGGGEGGTTAPPPNRHKNHSLKKAKSIEKLGGGTRYMF